MLSKERSTVLIVDDDREMLQSLRKVIAKRGYDALTAAGGQQGVESLRQHDVDVVITDLRMPSLDGMALLKVARTICPHVQVIILTAYGTVDRAVEALKAGASSFILKPFKAATLVDAIERAIERRCLAVDPSRRPPAELPGVIGRSKAVREIADLVARVAPTAATVLIEGESGTGKELIADAIHALSDRAEKRLIKVNCSALPETLLEAELFGHERGAFTSAYTSRRGRFDLAHGGTIFLDEIGALNPSAQVKLLRILQSGEMTRLGSSEPIHLDVRILSATNAPLEIALTNGTFRDDLYYRLNVVKIRIPPLRERAEDVPPLVDHFIQKYRTKNRKRITGITRQALHMLERYPWPGNCRELENAIERAVVLARGEVIGPNDLPEALRTQPAKANDMVVPIGTTMRDVQRRIIEETLKFTDGDKTVAAGLLGIARRTISRRLSEQPPPEP